MFRLLFPFLVLECADLMRTDMLSLELVYRTIFFMNESKNVVLVGW